MIKKKCIIDINQYQNRVICILNETLIMNCYHEFHYGCFLKYIKVKYYNKERDRDIDFFIECPLCRYRLDLNQIKDIVVRRSNLFNNIKKNIFIDIKRLQREIFLYKMKLYCKKTLYIKNNVNEIFIYNQMIDMLEESEFLYNKIKYVLIKDLY